MKTTSGAHIQVIGPLAFKVGRGEIGERIRAQADYIRWLQSPYMPFVRLKVPGGYVMDKLYPYENQDRFHMTYVIADALANSVWLLDAPDVKFSPVTHRDYVRQRAREADVAMVGSDLLRTSLSINWSDLQYHAVHGDPTYDNLMARYRGSQMPVLIDPLPPYLDGRMPNARAVDIGKILQSCYGYEDIKYRRNHKAEVYVPTLKRYTKNDNEWLASLYFCAVHYLRLIPYQSFVDRQAHTAIFYRVVADMNLFRREMYLE
jgi:hypothetical protein